MRIGAILLLTGCAGPGAPPDAAFTVSDHIGHVMTAWKDTPDGRGLLPTAMSEATIANLHAGLALQNKDDPGAIKLHVGHVLHAIDPSLMEGGPGLGYGLANAVAGVITHTRLAAETPGASENVRLHAEHVITSATNVRQWADEGKMIARQAMATNDLEVAAELVEKLKASTAAIVKGIDADGDGEVTWIAGEGGLRQAEKHMQLMAEGEGLTG